MRTREILQQAAEKLENGIQLPVRVARPEANAPDGGPVDAILLIDEKVAFAVELKQEVHRANLPQVLAQLPRGENMTPMVVARAISAPAKELLREKGISYLDLAGNCFITQGKGFHIQIEGRKVEHAGPERKHVAFNKNGIKLIYGLLLDDALLNQSYEQMAGAVGIAKSTIGGILQDLKAGKFLLQVSQEKRKLNNVEGLAERWVSSFHEKLQPKLLRGRFRFLPGRETEWKDQALGPDAYWGGEPAAALLTSYLSPQEWTIYTRKSRSDLLKDLSLVPDPRDGNVWVYDTFWSANQAPWVDEARQIVHPLLVYADLVGTDDNRNFETARKVHEQALSTHFAE